MNEIWLERLKNLASVKLTLYCLGLMMVLVFFGTIAQCDFSPRAISSTHVAMCFTASSAG